MLLQQLGVISTIRTSVQTPPLLSLDRPELVVKKLRYYARYIVVCLLLNKMDLVKVLVKVLKRFTAGPFPPLHHFKSMRQMQNQVQHLERRSKGPPQEEVEEVTSCPASWQRRP